MRLLFPAIILGVGLLLSPALAQAQTWNLQVVDDAGDAGYDSQIVVTSDGTPYIIYKTSSVLYIAKWVSGGGGGGGWQYKQLDNSCPANSAFEVLVDSQDHLHFAYGRQASPYAKYGIYNPATETWILGPEAIAGGTYTCYVDLALVTIGPDLIPCVTINNDNTTVAVYKRNPATGAWTGGVIDTIHNSGRPASIAIDSTNHMHVSFYEYSGQNLMYATKAWDDPTWQVSTVDITGNVGDYSSIAVTPDDRVHIVYYDATNGDLKYATLTP